MDRCVVLAGLVAVCVLGPRLAPSATEGAFDARVLLGNELSLAALGPPSGLTAVPVGLDVELAWASGTGGSGYRVESAGNGSSDDCIGAVFTATASTPGTAYTDSPSGAAGTRRCYRVRTAYESWTSATGDPVAVVRLGVVATSLTLANAVDTTGCASSGQAGTLDCGDRITVTFNQPMDTATGPSGSHTVCTDPATGVVVLGAIAGSGGCSASEPSSVGALAGGTVGADARYAAGFAWSDGGRTLTVAVGNRLEGSAAAIGAGPWTFTPADGLEAATGGYGVCTSGADCLPEATGTP